MNRPVQYTQLEYVTSVKDRRNVMDTIYEILEDEKAFNEKSAMESEAIHGKMHIENILNNINAAKSNDAATFTIPSIVGSVASVMAKLKILGKVEPSGKNKRKWYIIGDKNIIHDDNKWKEYNLLKR